MLDFLFDLNRGQFTQGMSKVDPFTANFFDDRQIELSKRVSKERYRHVLGVVEMAQILAETYQVDIQKARLAALLHDWDKDYTNQQMRERIYEVGADSLTTKEVIEKMPKVLHGLTAAFALGIQYPQIPSDVLRAIIDHTTANTHMNGLSMVVYCADALEPNRKYPEYEELIDLIGKVPLHDLFVKIYMYSTINVLKSHKTMHPRTAEIWNYHIEKYNRRHS